MSGSCAKTACSGRAPTKMPSRHAAHVPRPLRHRRRTRAVPPGRIPAAPPRFPTTNYPYFLTTGRVLAQYQSGTQTRRVKELAKAEPEAFVEIHPDTAAGLGIAAGDRIRLTTRRGRAVMKARLTRDIRLDTVFAPFHWGGGGSANALTNPALDPISRIPEFKVCAVRVEKVAAAGAARSLAASLASEGPMANLKLVVVGNGMAGARAVEEVLARGGERFDIVMFGAEPYGNYNRILLSSILSGAQDPSDIFIHPLEWYERQQRQAACRRGRDRDRPRGQGRGFRERHLRTLRQAPDRDRQPRLHPADGGREFGGRHDQAGGIRLPHHRRLRCHHSKAKQSRCAAVIGGGLLGLEAARGLLNHGCEVHVVHLRRAPHGDAARSDRRRDPEIDHGSDGRQGSSRQAHQRGARRGRRSPGSPSRTAPRSTATWSSSPPASVPMLKSGRAAGSRSSAPSWSTITCARSTIPTSTPSANARSIAAASTAWWRRCGSRPRCSPSTSPAAIRTPPITAPSSPPSSRSWAWSSRPWASPSPPRSATRSSSSPSRRRAPTRS